MSRSIRRFPKTWVCGDSAKDEKWLGRKAWRRACKMALARGDDVLPILREVTDPWGWYADGKWYMPDWPEVHRK